MRVYGENVSHIIVDSNLTLQDVMKSLKMTDNLPADIYLVNDAWLTESISSAAQRDPKLFRFQVPGAQQPPEMAQRSSEQPASATPQNPAQVSDTADPDPLHEIMEQVKDIPVSFGEDEAVSEALEDPQLNHHFQAKFSCMQKHDGSDSNPNSSTIEILQKMASYYDRTGDTWRTIAYRKCMTALRKQSELIITREQAIKIPGIGTRLADKIEEIVTTSKLRRLDHTTTDPDEQVLQLFMGIYQVGYPTASRWIAQGHGTLQDLKNRVELTENQRVGIEHYDDFLQRIPRAEVSQHAAIVSKALQDADEGMQAIVGGSYRRGNDTSGDIDVLITKKDASMANIRNIVMDTVVPRLQRCRFLKAALATGTTRDEGSKWHGASALPGYAQPWRRIDLLFVPWDELGAALLYFTGNDIFNRSIRLLASRKGMRLNQHGLFGNVLRGEKRARVTDGTLLEGHSEERIFEILEVPWRPPHHRKC